MGTLEIISIECAGTLSDPISPPPFVPQGRLSESRKSNQHEQKVRGEAAAVMRVIWRNCFASKNRMYLISRHRQFLLGIRFLRRLLLFLDAHIAFRRSYHLDVVFITYFSEISRN